MLKIDLTPDVSIMRRAFANLSDKHFGQALTRALNHVAAKARTQASRDIRKAYHMPAAQLRKDLVIERARAGRLSAKIISKGKPVPVYSFGANQIRRGVSVKIAGAKRNTIKSAFVMKLKNGHVGVFARGRYNGPFDFRKKRASGKKPDLPINELYSKSVPRALVNEAILGSLKTSIARDLPARVKHEVAFVLSSLKSKRR